MSEIQHPEAPVNPLVALLARVGLREYERMSAAGVDDEGNKIRNLTSEFLQGYAFRSIKDACDRIPVDKLIKINVPKLDSAGKIVSKDGYVETEERHVFERQYVRKNLLAERKLSEKDMKAWESENP